MERKIIKINMEVNELETRKTIENTTETKRFFFKIIKLTRLTKKKIEMTQFNKIINE